MPWAETYIGIPWSATGEGPETYHCWAFVRHIQKEHFGRTLPAIPNPEDVLAIARGFRDHPERRRWNLVKEPADGDCALMRQARYPIHVGVWLDVDAKGNECGILHCSQEAGVAFQSLNSLSLNGWSVEGFYRFTG